MEQKTKQTFLMKGKDGIFYELEESSEQQTAVEYLFEQLWETPKDKFTWHSILEKAIKDEKEQIKKAWVSAWQDSMMNPLGYEYYEPEADDYYNETYKNK